MKRTALTYAAVALAAAVIAVAAVVVADRSADADTTLESPPPEAGWGPRHGATEHVDWDSELAFQGCCDDSVEESDYSRDGGPAFRSYLRYGDERVADGPRAETHTARWDESRFGPGDTVYYGFSVYLVSTWEPDSSEDIVFQWHTEPEDCETDKPPSAFLSVQPEGMWRLRVNSDDDPCTTADSVEKTGFDLADAAPGQWHDFVFAFRWDSTDTGVVKVWHQTDLAPGWEQVLDTTGPNTFNDAEASGYLKWGLYKPAWNDGPTDVPSRVVFHDNIAFGAGFDAVDPSG
ncbi:polysaccharide lyase [Glycomyces mayteni]|uniref:Polysaccharide lyase n=1 Tax=Glycomyces mayteni TaxID=543887 RepID=A0ABW2DBI0_9ACTN|nr:hypothetical protein GCM10025732_12870 [Glycomyces mayteni]